MDFQKEELRLAVSELANRNIHIGTSSWKYEGWLDLLYTPERYHYRGKLAQSRFKENCLTEYAETFRTVSVDAGYYQFPTHDYLRKLASKVPEDFRFSFKVTDTITLKHFHRLERHGDLAGKSNPDFLNAGLFLEKFLAPCAEFRHKIGVLMFEFSPFHRRDFQRGRDFVQALDAFLTKLPRDWQYGVEIRNREFLHPEYFAVLRSHEVSHIYNNWTRMPAVLEQMEIADSFTTDFFASRFLLRPGRTFENAVKEFTPYDKIRDKNPEARAAIKKLSKKKTKRPSFIFVNNRLEGNSLRTILAALREEKGS